MTALRQEALQMVNDMPEYLLVATLQFMKKLKFKEVDRAEDTVNDEDVFTKRAQAIADIKEWQKLNEDLLKSDIDWDKEIEMALEEKYGSFN